MRPSSTGTPAFPLETHSVNGLNNFKTVGLNFDSKQRAPTISIIHKKKDPKYVCNKLSEFNICAWDGHFYAKRAIECMGLEKKGGVTRLGISIYNTKDEIERTIKALSSI